jgi:hypothetical protein
MMGNNATMNQASKRDGHIWDCMPGAVGVKGRCQNLVQKPERCCERIFLLKKLSLK